MAVFLMFLLVVPFVMAGVLCGAARVLPPFIRYMHDRGKGWGGIFLVLPVLIVARIVGHKYPEGDLDDTTPLKQLSTAAGWWWVGLIPAMVVYVITQY